jgi:murein DD-endopeptidase MepM/ murein hydrolase activator NlpD
MTGVVFVRHTEATNSFNTGRNKLRFVIWYLHFALVGSLWTLAVPALARKNLVATPAPGIGAAPSSAPQRHRIGGQASVFGLLGQYGFSEHHRREIIKSAPVPRELTLARGDFFLVKRSSDSNRVELKLYHRTRSQAYNFWRQGQRAGLTVGPAHFQVRRRTAKGQIEGSLISSVERLTGKEDVAYRLMDAFHFRHPQLSRKLQRGARFEVVYEEMLDQGHPIRLGEVLEVALEIDGQMDRRFFLPFDGGGAFVSKTDRQNDRAFFAPVNYVRISSLFQPRRMHPITRRRIPHMGVDFELPTGEPVFAIGSGTVKRWGRTRGAGRFVVVDHGSGTLSYYNHLDSVRQDLRVGMKIPAGGPLGTVGCTGYCTKPHLHLAISRGGRWVDPLAFLKTYPYRESQAVARRIARL